MLRLFLRLLGSLVLLGLSWIAFLVVFNVGLRLDLLGIGSLAVLLACGWGLWAVWRTPARRKTDLDSAHPKPEAVAEPESKSDVFDENGFLQFLAARNLLDANLPVHELAALRREFRDAQV